MPFGIQRVPRGLGELLNIFGGQTPRELEDRVRGSLEMLQMYGTTQLQGAFANNAAAAEGAAVSAVLSAERWTVVFGVNAAFVKTATMTALAGRCVINRSVSFSLLVAAESNLGPFGATETGTVNIGGILPYPLICPPGTAVQAVAAVIGTDATANVSIFAEFGVIS